jgi:hypothetical protein
LLLSKWTAVPPLNREKHFVVVRMIEPEPPAVRSLKRHAVQDADSLSRVNETAWQGRTGLETAKARFAKDESAVIGWTARSSWPARVGTNRPAT